MQKIGEMRPHGLNKKDLMRIRSIFKKEGFTVRLIKLHRRIKEEDLEKLEDVKRCLNYTRAEPVYALPAYILIIRKGLNYFVNADEFYEEQQALKKDTQAFMYGRVVNKIASCYTPA